MFLSDLFIIRLFQYMQENASKLLLLTYDHILMVLIGIGTAFIVGVPLGILSAKKEKFAGPILTIANIIQVFPSLALLALLMIFFGLGFTTVVIGLFLYSLLPIIRNTYVGIKEVSPSLSDAGKGIGMNTLQLLFKIQLPLALPFLMAGLRLAAVIAIGVATIAPLIGGGGLGREVYAGINFRNEIRIYAGAIPAALLAISADIILGRLQQRFKTKESSKN